LEKSLQHWVTEVVHEIRVRTFKNSDVLPTVGVGATDAVAVLVSVYEVEIDGVGDFETDIEPVAVIEGSMVGWKEGIVGNEAPGGGDTDGTLTVAEGVEEGFNVGEGLSIGGGVASGEGIGVAGDGDGRLDGSCCIITGPFTEAYETKKDAALETST
jgi:hypothetical protein